MKKRRVISSIIVGFIFACFFVIGQQLNDDSMIHFNGITALNLLLTTVVCSSFIFYILGLNYKIKTDKNFKLDWKKVFLPLMAISLFLLLAIYPGNYSYDSIFQYRRYYLGIYGTHYPPIFCWLLGTFLTVGNNIFGNFEIGLFTLLLLQSAFINFVITKIILYTSDRIKNKKFTIISILFLATHLLAQVLIISSCHDVIFGGFFALLTLEFLKMSEVEDYFKSKKNFFKVGAITILMCLFRNNGFFALIPAVVIGLIFLKKNRVRFSIMLLIPMIIFQGYNQVYSRFISSDTQSFVHESLNLPVMQIARALYYNHPQTWSEELNTYFYEVCDWASYKRFTGISDNFKHCIKDEYVQGHLVKFVGYWLKLGLKAPHRYIEAPGLLSLGLWYPWKTYPEDAHGKANIWHPYIEHAVVDATNRYPENEAAPIKRHALIPVFDRFLDHVLNGQRWSQIYGIRVLWGGAFTTFTMIIAILFALYKKQRQYLIPLGLIFSLTLTVFLAPVVLFRYIFPVVLTTPIMFYIIVKTCTKKSS